MAAGFNSFDSSFNAFTHSGFNARGGTTTQIISGILCCDPATGVVRWSRRLEGFVGVGDIGRPDMSGNFYVQDNELGVYSFIKMTPTGVKEWVVPAPIDATGIGLETAQAGVWISSTQTLLMRALTNTGAILSAIGTRTYTGVDGEMYTTTTGNGLPPPVNGQRQDLTPALVLAWDLLNAGAAQRSFTNLGLPNLYSAGQAGSVSRVLFINRSSGASSTMNLPSLHTGGMACVQPNGDFWMRDFFGVYRYGIGGGAPNLTLPQYSDVHTDLAGNLFAVTQGTNLFHRINDNGVFQAAVPIDRSVAIGSVLRFADLTGGGFANIGVNVRRLDANGNQTRLYQYPGGSVGLYDYRAGLLFLVFTGPEPVPSVL